MSVPNVLFNVGYAQNEETILSKNLGEQYLSERLFYSCKQSDDYIKYIDKGIVAGNVLGYVNNNEKCSGIFNQDGLFTRKQRGELRTKLRNTKSIIWHTVISFTEDFGAEFMSSGKNAQELLNAELPRFFKRIGMPVENVEWFAGLHENTDNRHIHLSFFEKEPIYLSSRDKSKKRFRYGKISKAAMDSFVVGVEARLTNVAFDLKKSRKELMSISKEVLYSDGTKSFELELKNKLLRLYRALPTSGRIGYNSLNVAGLRPQIREIVDFAIKNNPSVKSKFQKFCTDLIMRDDKVKAICDRQKMSDADTLNYLVEDKYLEDIYRRLGDKVIQATFAIKQREERGKRKCKSYLLTKRLEQRHRHYLLGKSLKIAEEVDCEAVNLFEEYRKKLAHTEYERLIEEGVIEAD